MKKRLLAGLLALTLVFSGSISAAAAESSVAAETMIEEDTTVEADAQAKETTAKIAEPEEKEEEETAGETEATAEDEAAENAETIKSIEPAAGELMEAEEEAADETEEAAEAVQEAVSADYAEGKSGNEAQEWTEAETEYVLNPIYDQEYTTEDLVAYMAQQDENDIEKRFQAAVYEYDSITDAANAIKNEMKVRNTACTIITKKSNSYKDIFNQALVDSVATAPNEGDYLRANWYGYKMTHYTSSTQSKYVFTLMYVDDAQKEAAVTNMIPSVLNSLNLAGKTDYEKVKIIHDYVCKKIEYKTDGKSLVYHSTYGALINGQAVCQGYASLFYRLCREAGIPVRFITGTGSNEAHAWNIVKIGNYYYNLDATWADQEDYIIYDYFLRNEKNFTDHTRKVDDRDGMSYTSSQFHAAHPMGTVDYGAMAQMNVANLTKTFTATDGTAVTSAAAGKPKVLVFFSTGSNNSKNTMAALSRSSYVTSGAVDVAAVDTNGSSKAAVEEFKKSYGYSSMNFCYDEGMTASDISIEYDDTYGTGSYYPGIYYIDANNRVRAMTCNVQTQAQMDAILAAIVSDNAGKTYAITAGAGIGGTITPNGVTNVAAGGSVTYAIAPVSGYGIEDVKVDGKSIGAKTGYTFSNVTGEHTIAASFAKVSAENPFADVKANAYYATPVKWAVSRGITNGTSATTFEPGANCTRGQIVTFLWRAAGSPQPRSTSNPFADVKSSAYYYKAVLWAVEKGITSGTSANTFSPEAVCTRAQTVTFLYRYAGAPAVGSVSNPFGDVKNGAYYYNPVLWAMKTGVTSGTSANAFSPEQDCTRGQIVTFLYRQAN